MGGKCKRGTFTSILRKVKGNRVLTDTVRKGLHNCFEAVRKLRGGWQGVWNDFNDLAVASELTQNLNVSGPRVGFAVKIIIRMNMGIM